MTSKLKELYDKFSGTLIIRAFTSWCIAAVVFLLWADSGVQSIKGFGKISLTAVLLTTGIAFALLTLLSLIFKKISTDVYTLPLFFGVYSFLVAYSAENMYTVFGLGALWAILFHYYHQRGFLRDKEPGEKRLKLSLGAVVLVFLFFVGGIGVLRYLTYSTPNFDFGIFCNMFYNMKQRLVPLVTCERDRLLSHFSVHISPIYYVLLPFYSIFPSGITLQLAQAVLIASGIVPVFLLAKHFSVKNKYILPMGILYLLSPVLASGTNYDFHENCFLAPLLLWMFYFFEKQKYIPFAIFAALTLCVKEDAAVYVIFFALFMLFDRKKVLPGIITAIIASAYFVLAVRYLSEYGDGAMTARFGNFMSENGGLIEVIKNIIANPAYVFSQLFVSKDGSYSDKLLFILQMLAPLGFLPLNAKKPSRLILLLPMLLINLMPLYVYQYNIGYQYSFGSFSFLFYLALINLSEKQDSLAPWLTKTAVAVTAMSFVLCAVQRHEIYLTAWSSNAPVYQLFDEAVKEIPQDKSVICTTFLLPHLSNRDEIYELEYHDFENGEKCDYVLIDMRQDYSSWIEKYQAAGYKITETRKIGDTDILTVMQP